MERKYRLVICESTTGIVLDRNLDHYKDHQGSEPCIYFDSMNEVEQFIGARNKENVCYEVFDRSGNLVFEFYS